MSSPSSTIFDQAFEEYLELVNTCPSPDLDEFVARFPKEIAEELRQLVTDYEKLCGAPTTPPSARIAPGAQLNDFKLIRELGQGASAVVWEAEQQSLERRVALKILRPQYSLLSDEAVTRFIKEAKVGGRLGHPNIVQTLSIDRVEDLIFIVQELVPGGQSLRDFLDELDKKATLPKNYYRIVAELFQQIASALCFAHEDGIIHRDIKPSNILLTQDGKPQVADFGLALMADGKDLTATGAVRGTPYYMSPEQVAGKRLGLDFRSDVFSLGATLYEFLTLNRPFHGDSLEQAYRQIMHDDPPDPRSIRSQVPKELVWICGKCMEKKADRRYSSMRELLDDFIRFLDHKPVLARAPSISHRVAKWNRRHPVVSSVLAVLLVTSTAIAGLYAETNRYADQLEEDNYIYVMGDRLKELKDRARELWPLSPEILDKTRAWLDDARELAGERSRLDELMSLSQAHHMREQLEQVVASFHQFTDPDNGWVEGIGHEFGWGVARRQAFAKTMVEQTIDAPDVRERWSQAIASIADPSQCPDYEGLRIQPQIGLIPLGRNASTGLWEFGHLQSGALPHYDANTGTLRLSRDSCVVLVLLPGGEFYAGAQSLVPSGLNFDPLATGEEGPVHLVTLEPFFISKYEVTQSQWQRITGRNPSFFSVNPNGSSRALYPVEMVSWTRAQEVVRWLGMKLPTESQWEYAARGGTSTPWWTGEQEESLQGAICFERNPDEGPTRVDSLAANPFGLHHILGNLWEWCENRNRPYLEDPSRTGTHAEHSKFEFRSMRGGSFVATPTYVRVSRRYHDLESYRTRYLGLRPVRPLAP